MTHFKVTATDPRVQYTATAGQTVFNIPFEFYDNDDIAVYLDDATVKESSGYTATGERTDGGGNVTFDTGLTVGTLVTIENEPDIERATDFNEGGAGWTSDNVNNELDRFVILLKVLENIAKNRTPIFSPSTNLSTFSAILPALVAGGLLRVKEDLTSFELVLATDIDMATVSSFIATLLDDADQAAAQATLGLEVGVNVQAYDANTMKSDESAALTAGFTYTVLDHGNSGTDALNLAFAGGLQQKITATGSFTINAPSTGNGYIELLLVMDGTGGYTITLAGFETTIAGVIDTTASVKNLLRMTRIDGNDAVEIVQLD